MLHVATTHILLPREPQTDQDQTSVLSLKCTLGEKRGKVKLHGTPLGGQEVGGAAAADDWCGPGGGAAGDHTEAGVMEGQGEGCEFGVGEVGCEAGGRVKEVAATRGL